MPKVMRPSWAFLDFTDVMLYGLEHGSGKCSISFPCLPSGPSVFCRCCWRLDTYHFAMALEYFRGKVLVVPPVLPVEASRQIIFEWPWSLVRKVSPCPTLLVFGYGYFFWFVPSLSKFALDCFWGGHAMLRLGLAGRVAPAPCSFILGSANNSAFSLPCTNFAWIFWCVIFVRHGATSNIRGCGAIVYLVPPVWCFRCFRAGVRTWTRYGRDSWWLATVWSAIGMLAGVVFWRQIWEHNGNTMMRLHNAISRYEVSSAVHRVEHRSTRFLFQVCCSSIYKLGHR